MSKNKNDLDEMADIVIKNTKRIARRSAPIIITGIKTGAKAAMDALYKIAFK